MSAGTSPVIDDPAEDTVDDTVPTAPDTVDVTPPTVLGAEVPPGNAGATSEGRVDVTMPVMPDNPEGLGGVTGSAGSEGTPVSAPTARGMGSDDAVLEGTAAGDGTAGALTFGEVAVGPTADEVPGATWPGTARAEGVSVRWPSASLRDSPVEGGDGVVWAELVVAAAADEP